MRFRWTEKKLRESSDNEIIRTIIAERKSDLNYYSSLCIRLKKLYDKYDQKVKYENSNK